MHAYPGTRPQDPGSHSRTDCALVQVLLQGCGAVSLIATSAHLHDVVRVALKHLGAGPALVPVPQLDEHVIRGGQDVGQAGVHSNTPTAQCPVSLSRSRL